MTTPAEPNGSTAVRSRADRGERALTALVGALVAVFVALALGLPLLGLRVFSAADLLLAYPPWKDQVATTYHPGNPCVSDTVDGVLPAEAEIRRGLDQGRLATWDPLEAGGAPLATLPDSALLSPISLPHLVLPESLAPGYTKLLEILVSVGASFAFLRRLRLRRPAALLGGLVFTTSGFMVSWTNWPQTRTAALLPALFWATEVFVQRRSIRSVLAVAAVVAAMLAGGFPQVTGFGIYAAGAYLLLRLAVVDRRRPARGALGVVAAGGGLLLGVALMAVQLVPFVLRLRTLDLAYRNGASGPLPLRSLATLGFPQAFGSCPGPAVWFGPLNQVETNAFLGTAALVLVLVALVARRPTRLPVGVRGFFVAAAAVCVLISYQGGPVHDLAVQLPIFKGNNLGRIRSVLGFFLAVLVAIGVDALLARRRTPSRQPRELLALARRHLPRLVWMAVVLLAAGYAAAETIRFVRRFALENGQLPFVAAQMRKPLAGAAVAVLLVAVAVVLPRWRRVAVAGLAVVVAYQGTAMAVPFWPRIPRSHFYPRTPVHTFLADHLGGERYGAVGLTMFPGTNVWYGLRSVGGHSFTDTSYRQLLTAADRKAFITPTFSTFRTASAVRSPVLDRLAVKYWVTAPTDALYGTPQQLGAAGSSTSLEPGRPVELGLRPGPLRGVGVRLNGPATVRDPRAALDADLLGSGGAVVAHGSLRLPSSPPGNLWVPVAAETGPAAAATRVRLTLRAGGDRLAVAGDAGGGPRLTVVRPADDGLRLVFTDGASVYERRTALPRVRWAAQAEVVGTPAARLAALRRPAGRAPAVLLDKPGPNAAGAAADVRVRTDRGGTVAADVRAAGAGYLVVADALQNGWSVEVDGREQTLRNADHAFVAVAVPAGSHRVRFHYDAPGLLAGLTLSVVALVVAAALLVSDAALRRRRVAGDEMAGPAGEEDVESPAAPEGEAGGRGPRDAERVGAPAEQEPG